MTAERDCRDPDRYELRVGRHLDDHWAAWFGDLALTRHDDGTTTLRGAVPDQAALHGLLTKVRDLGMTLLSVQALNRPDGAVGPREQHGPPPGMTSGHTTRSEK